jgi:uncharacterized protein (DUF885 family)
MTTTEQLDRIAAPIVATEVDRQFATLVRRHFEDLVALDPIRATAYGIHEHDGRLPDYTREAKLAQAEAEHRFVAAIEAIDGDALSPANRFERELAVGRARLSLFGLEEYRLWERRTTAADEIGDALFLLFARDFAPLPDRLAAITSRLEATPRALMEVRGRLVAGSVRLWQELEAEAADHLPSFIDEVARAGASALDGRPELRRLERAAHAAKASLADHASWVREGLARAGGDIALGRERLDALIELRSLDGLTADDILAIGEDQLAAHHEARRRAALELDPGASEAEVLSRVKSDHPRTFDEALTGYRDVMARARSFIIEHDLATIPKDETLEVVPTPEYLRRVIPFAAYFQPTLFDLPRKGIYIVTPSVNGSPGAMREHNYASIANTSIHEAYPGHHHQLSAALERPTISRLLRGATEFEEGWGMYSEQLMREHGFDATPAHRVILATDAIWRACRIILDIRLHRGETSVQDAVEFLIEHTGFERENAEAEVQRYTYTPTYQLSYLLGKVLLLRLRDDERRRLGSAFSLRSFHDALLWSGSIPVSFHRRLLAGEGGGPFRPGGGHPA